MVKKIKDPAARSALLIVDMISDFEFTDGEQLFKHAVPAADKIIKLKKRAQGAGWPVIYVNDNYGRWQEDFAHQVTRIIKKKCLGREIAEMLRPGREDYYILKPHRSGFYETPLEVLLSSLGVGKVVITGVTTDICVLFTAHDADMRGLKVIVPEDCSAAVAPTHHSSALALLRRAAHTETTASAELETE
ncbi:MAG TPA: isochorismatase family cysteine hydrolase [Pyrinomonadaceae bacterium]|nr:isochorismatase family cysteine hydrolase [Pyrinomonadaceae bacterium]